MFSSKAKKKDAEKKIERKERISSSEEDTDQLSSDTRFQHHSKIYFTLRLLRKCNVLYSKDARTILIGIIVKYKIEYCLF